MAWCERMALAWMTNYAVFKTNYNITYAGGKSTSSFANNETSKNCTVLLPYKLLDTQFKLKPFYFTHYSEQHLLLWRSKQNNFGRLLCAWGDIGM